MAEENKNPVDDIASDIGIPKQPKEAGPPSTGQAQEETQKANEAAQQQERSVDRVQADMQGASKFGTKDVSRLQAQKKFIDELDKKEEDERLELEKKTTEEKLQLEKNVQEYEDLKNRYAQRGLKFETNDKIEAFIARREQEQQAAVEAEKSRVQEEIEAQREREVFEQEQLVKQEQEALKIEEARETAKSLNTQEKLEEIKQRQAEIQNELQKEDEELQKIDPKRYWKNMSTWERIWANISLVLAGAGAGLAGTDNFTLRRIQKEIDADIEAQKLNNKNRLAKKSNALKMIQFELDKIESQSQNELRKLKIQQFKQNLALQQQQVDKDRVIARQIAKKGSDAEIPLSALTPEKRKEATELRKEYNKQTKDLGTEELIQQYKVIDQAAKAKGTDTGPADISLIFSYMKVLDPRSVVREGEFATAQDTGSIPSKIVSVYNRLVEGGRLSQAQRQAFVNQATKVMQEKLNRQRAVNQRYSRLATSSQIPASAVIQKFDNVLSKREQLVLDQMEKNKSLSRNQIERSIDKLIEKGQLPADKYGR